MSFERQFKEFLQMITNRRAVGELRYGAPKAIQNYMTRMEKEMKAYRKTGNQEQLINIAVYCFLESVTPENPKFHFDNTAESVTRKSMGGNRE
jgi:hypothetical protein